MGEGFGGEWIHAFIWLGHFSVHLKLSHHYQLAILQDKIKKDFKKKGQASHFFRIATIWMCYGSS